MNIDNFGAMPSALDLGLYVGVVIVLYVLFKDKLGFVKEYADKFLKSAPNLVEDIVIIDDKVPADDIHDDSELFFRLIKSWKQTKDLAEQYGADKAVEIADEMFPHLIPKEEKNVERENTVSYS